jgi:hypothetical protein
MVRCVTPVLVCVLGLSAPLPGAPDTEPGALERALAPQGAFLDLSGRSVESVAVAGKAAANYGSRVPTLVDPPAGVAREHGARWALVTVVADRHGIVTGRATGSRTWDGKEAVASLRAEALRSLTVEETRS